MGRNHPVSGGAGVERLDWSYDLYDIAPFCSSPKLILAAGTIVASGIAVVTADPGVAEVWSIDINGLPSGDTITLPAAATTVGPTVHALAVAAGDVVQLRPTNGANPASPSACGTITLHVV